MGDVIKSAISNSGDQIESKLVKNVKSFHVSNGKTNEDSHSISKMASIIREQEAKFQELEQKVQDCRNKDEGYKQLSQRIFELETRLNLTIQQIKSTKEGLWLLMLTEASHLIFNNLL